MMGMEGGGGSGTAAVAVMHQSWEGLNVFSGGDN